MESEDAELLSTNLKKASGLKADNVREYFFSALDKRLYQCVESFIMAKFKFNLNELRNEQGEQPLFIALNKDDTKMVEALCKKKMNNTKGIRRGSGQTPLHVAAQKGDLAMVEALLNAGFDPNSGRLNLTQ